MIASAVTPVVRRVIPGRAIPEGVTPESEGSVKAWLESHAGRVAANAEACAAKMEGGGYDSLYNLEFDHNDLVGLGVPEGHAKTIATNAVCISRLWQRNRVLISLKVRVRGERGAASPMERRRWRG